MDITTAEQLAMRKKLDSLTRNLLECFEELDLIYRISSRILTTPNIGAQLTLILDEAVEILEADQGWLYLVDGDDDDEPGRDYHFQVTPSLTERINRDIVQPHIASGESTSYYNLAETMAGDMLSDLPGPFICTLLKSGEAVHGALCLGRHNPDRFFSAGDIKLADVLASYASLALVNARMSREKIRQEQARFHMEEELRLAAQIHRNFLPKSAPRIEGYDVAGCSIPARMVGGDYYDFIPLEDGRLAFCLADVSGKGLPASLLMSNVQATIRSHALLNLSPDECVSRANRLFCHSMKTGKFVTMFYGVLDYRRHVIRYANAGHSPPLALSARTGPSVLRPSGMILGFLEDSRYTTETLQLAPGDMLVIYSDGISDALDNGGGESGETRLTRRVSEMVHLPAAELVARILDTLPDQSADTPPRDDRTLLVIKRS